MEERSAKIRFKIGALEVDCEGREEFLENHLERLASKLIKMCLEHQKDLAQFSPPQIESNANTNKGQSLIQNPLDMSTNTIATTIGATSGTDLVVAASAHLCLVKKMSTFTRNDLIEEIKSATTFYKQSYISNLSKSINSLVKNKRLNLVSKNTYNLSPNERSALETKLA